MLSTQDHELMGKCHLILHQVKFEFCFNTTFIDRITNSILCTQYTVENFVFTVRHMTEPLAVSNTAFNIHHPAGQWNDSFPLSPVFGILYCSKLTLKSENRANLFVPWQSVAAENVPHLACLVTFLETDLLLTTLSVSVGVGFGIQGGFLVDPEQW